MDYLKGYESRSELPAFNRGATSEEYGGKEKVISFSKELTTKITRIAKTHHVTINTVLQTATHTLLDNPSSMPPLLLYLVLPAI